MTDDAASPGHSDLCQCDHFRFWYWSGEDSCAYCHCGHADDEHINRKGSCTGEIAIK